jgi:uncharacterized protein
MLRRFAAVVVFFLIQCIAAWAINIPELKDRVTDLAGVLNPSEISALDSHLQELENTDSTQIAVLIIPSLEGESLEDVSIKVAEAWKLGQKGRDNGALLFISVKDHKLRIEVGYGLEPTLTDLRSGQIIRNDITPHFRAGDFYGGINAGVTGIIETVRGTYQASPEERPGRRSHSNRFNFLIILLFPLLWILSLTGKWGGGILGLGAGMLLPYTLIGHSLPLLLFGGIAGGLLGTFVGALVKAGSASGHGSGGGFGGPFWGGGGFGGGGGGFGGGGFSGGGGGFGGGGSSGSW